MRAITPVIPVGRHRPYDGLLHGFIRESSLSLLRSDSASSVGARHAGDTRLTCRSRRSEIVKIALTATPAGITLDHGYVGASAST